MRGETVLPSEGARLETPAAAPGAGRVLERVTIEAALYAGLFGVALFLRLFRLGLAPMSGDEAGQALAALRGAFLPSGGSPFLYAVNSFLFSLFSPSDALARLTPALAGSVLVLLPALFRDALGRLGALGAAVVLTFSPIALVAARSLSGEVIVVVCALLLLGLLRRYAATGDVRHLFGAAVAVGVGLASGPGAYTVLIAFIVSALVLRFAMGREPEGRALNLRAMFDVPQRAWIAGALVGAFILAATGGLLYLAGLGAAGDLLSAWLRAFGAADGLSAFDVIQIVLVYETLSFVVGSLGLSRALARADRFGAWLGFAALISLAVVVLQSGRQSTDLLFPVTLLALLAGYVFQAWGERMQARATLATDGIILAIGSAVVLFMWFQLAALVRGRFPPATIADIVIPAEVALAGLFVFLTVAVGALLSMMVEFRAVLRGAATLGLGVLLFGSLAAGWGATQVRVGDPREIVWGTRVTPVDVRDLVATAEQIAVRVQGHTVTLPIRVEVDDPVVGWYFRNARLPAGGVAAGVVTAFGGQPSDGQYIGARFNTRLAWDTLGLDTRTWLEWVLFRTSAAELPPAVETVTLWQRR